MNVNGQPLEEYEKRTRQAATTGVTAANAALARASADAQRRLTGGGRVHGLGLLNPIPGGVPEALGIAATLPVGGSLLTGPLKRALVGGAVTGGAALLGGNKPGQALERGAGAAGGQLLGEAAVAPFRELALRRSARKLGALPTPAEIEERVQGAETEYEQRRYASKVAYEAEKTRQRQAWDQQAAKARVSQREWQAYEGRVKEARQQYAAQLRAAREQYQHGKFASEQSYEAHVRHLEGQYAATVSLAQERGAAIVADYFKRAVPPFAEYASNQRGLGDMVYGTGPEKLSAYFDQALKTEVARAKGTLIEVSLGDASALRLTPLEGGRISPTGEPMTVKVDAGDAIGAVTGTFRKNPVLYRRVTGTLADAGFGNEEARAAYKAGQALFDFADTTSAIERVPGGAVFHPEKVSPGLVDTSKLAEVRGRGHGDIYRGPFAEAANLAVPPFEKPPKPAVPPFQRPPGPAAVPTPTARVPAPEPFRAPRKPLTPPFIEPSRSRTPPVPGVTVRTIPGGEHPFLTGHAVGITGAAAAQGTGMPWAAGFVPGEILGMTLPGSRVVTRAPLPSWLEGSLRAASGVPRYFLTNPNAEQP